MIHRDIKPSNVFIARLGKRTDFVKVLDFGLVKALADPDGTTATTRSQTTGTPAFMAPEQVRGEEVDARTDIYGLGCVAYFLLTGAVVFDKSSAMAMAMAHVTEQPEPPSNRSEIPIPPSLERVVMACLRKEPQGQAAVRGGASSDARCLHGRAAMVAGGRGPLVGAAPARAATQGVVMSAAREDRSARRRAWRWRSWV